MNITEQFQSRLEQEGEVGEFRGYKMRLRRLRAKLLYVRGRMPGYFSSAYRRAMRVEGEDEPTSAQLTRQEFDEASQWEIDVILDCCLEPKLKRDKDAPGDVLIDDVPDQVLEFIYLYATCVVDFPDQASQKEEVTAETLLPFLHDRTGADESGVIDASGATLRATSIVDVISGDAADVAAPIGAGF
jgi:hypothetical protein